MGIILVYGMVGMHQRNLTFLRDPFRHKKVENSHWECTMSGCHSMILQYSSRPGDTRSLAPG